jgi:hypothetical protein
LGVGTVQCAWIGARFAVRTTGAIWRLAASVALLAFRFRRLAVGINVTVMMLFVVIFALRTGRDVFGLVHRMWGLPESAWQYVLDNKEVATSAFSAAGTAVASGAQTALDFVRRQFAAPVPSSLGASLSDAPGPSSLGAAPGSFVIPSLESYLPGNCRFDMTKTQFRNSLQKIAHDYAAYRLDVSGLLSLMRQCSTNALACARGSDAERAYAACTEFLRRFLKT